MYMDNTGILTLVILDPRIACNCYIFEIILALKVESLFTILFHFFPQTGTVGVLNSYYNGSMDKMI